MRFREEVVGVVGGHPGSLPHRDGWLPRFQEAPWIVRDVPEKTSRIVSMRRRYPVSGMGGRAPRHCEECRWRLAATLAPGDRACVLRPITPEASQATGLLQIPAFSTALLPLSSVLLFDRGHPEPADRVSDDLEPSADDPHPWSRRIPGAASGGWEAMTGPQFS